MVGTGIFTSLGFQVGDLTTGFSIIILWFVGGVCALCGALSYAELGAALPRSGGEYHFLGVIYHPALGFLAGWVSATVGFPAPIALAAIAFGQYFVKILPHMPALVLWHWTLPAEKYLGLWVIVIATLFLLRNVRVGSAFQDASTLLKVGARAGRHRRRILPLQNAADFVSSRARRWQADHERPVRREPRVRHVFLFGLERFDVSRRRSARSGARHPAVGDSGNLDRHVILYLAVNAVFLLSTPTGEMAGKVEVGLIAGNHLFGPSGAKIMAGLICVGLVSMISAMIWIGARVTMVMGEDMRLLRPLARRTKYGVPVIATLLQFGIAVVLILGSTFDKVTKYVGFSLQICSFLVVLGLIVLRFTQPNLPRPYKTWGYPVTPLVFLFISAWMLLHIWRENPKESLMGLGTMALGLIFYAISPSRPPAVASLVSS
jgi:APA family basic amino acid/polyamine antiporter